MAVSQSLFKIAAAVTAIGAFYTHRHPLTKAGTDHNNIYSRQGDEAKRERMAARFAPQFDGLHCFETLVRD